MKTNPQCEKCGLTVGNASRKVREYMEENQMCYKPTSANDPASVVYGSEYCLNFKK